jgi:hypothetical protein
MEPVAAPSELHTRTMRKVAVRLLPVLLGLSSEQVRPRV